MNVHFEFIILSVNILNNTLIFVVFLAYFLTNLIYLSYKWFIDLFEIFEIII